MSDQEITLDSYLDEVGRQSHALARMVRNPEPENGLVYTPREIAQQPFLWRHTARQMKEHAPALKQFLEEAGLYDAADRSHVILTGAGTSDYVGLSVADLLRVHFRLPCSNWPTTRITAAPYAFFMKELRYVMLHCARSGNSPESSAVLDLALTHYPEKTRHVVITCNPEGRLARQAQALPEAIYPLVLHSACNDLGLAMTSSFSNMVVAGQAMAHLDDMDTFIDLIDRTAEAGELFIETYADDILQLASPELERVFYLGNNDLFGAATESALKVQELTVGEVTAKGEDTLAFRHGPISAVDERTMVCFFLSEDAYTRRYEADVLQQYQKAFRSMGVRTIVVAPRRPDVDLADGITVLTYDPEGAWGIPPFYQANLAVLFGQLFALFASYRRNLNVDDPSVQKALYSRTVQGVRLYEYTNGAEHH